MPDRPILFSAPMIRAILAGTKTQTRRLVTAKTWDPNEYVHKRVLSDGDAYHAFFTNEVEGDWLGVKCPYGVPGDRLWVRETWRTEELPDGTDGIRFAADESFIPIANTSDAAERWVVDHDNGRHGAKWRPSIFMRRWASRLTLEISDVRVARLQDISEADAKAEGVLPFGEAYSCFSPEQPITCGDGRPSFAAGSRPYAASYAVLWDEINEDRAPWVSNPWTWAITFKRQEVGHV